MKDPGGLMVALNLSPKKKEDKGYEKEEEMADDEMSEDEIKEEKTSAIKDIFAAIKSEDVEAFQDAMSRYKAACELSEEES